jgi:hypothetical protein
LVTHEGARTRRNLPPLTVQDILAWADEHHSRTGKWPTALSGAVHAAPHEHWMAIHSSLGVGTRGLPGGDTLARFLVRHRHAPKKGYRPKLTIKRILSWADAHHERTGQWPNQSTGKVDGVEGEHWSTLNSNLRRGSRGLRGNTTLARLLASRRGVPVYHLRPRLTHERIVKWADAHYRRTGRWPTTKSGPIYGTRDENWMKVDAALREGYRGLSKGSSLHKLLKKKRGVRLGGSRLSIRKVLAWIDEHAERTGRWPTHQSGRVHGVRNEQWGTIDTALKRGFRGLKGGSSLAKLLNRYRRIAWWENRKGYKYQIWSTNPPTKRRRADSSRTGQKGKKNAGKEMDQKKGRTRRVGRSGVSFN